MHPETVCAAGNSHAWLVVLSTQARLGASEILAVSWRRGPGRSHGASVGLEPERRRHGCGRVHAWLAALARIGI